MISTQHKNLRPGLFLLCFIAVGIVIFFGSAFKRKPLTTSGSELISKSKLEEARMFCRKQKLDTTVAIFIDMSIHSGKKRFFVVDLVKSKIISSSLVCHGMGKGSTESTPVFSNEEGSYCTSLGKYKTGLRAYSQYGIHIHYKLHGLEKTNNNAFKRVVVLHSYDPVDENEIYPGYLPMGWSLGCPVISNKQMTNIDKLLKEGKKNLLLWIYK
jgi:hypothetical protein